MATEDAHPLLPVVQHHLGVETISEEEGTQPPTEAEIKGRTLQAQEPSLAQTLLGPDAGNANRQIIGVRIALNLRKLKRQTGARFQKGTWELGNESSRQRTSEWRHWWEMENLTKPKTSNLD